MIKRNYVRALILLLLVTCSNWPVKLLAGEEHQTAQPSEKIELQSVAHLMQLSEIRGVVTDTTGLPIPGVSIGIKGKTGVGTTTDQNGD